MKRRVFASILAMLVLSCTACVNININGLDGTLQPDAPKIVTGEENDNGNTNPDITTPDVPAVTEEDTNRVTEGPEYLIARFEDQIGGYGDEPGARLMIQADQIFILTPGYEQLESSLDAMNANVYMQGIDEWDYQSFESFGGSDDMYTGTEWNDTYFYSVDRNDSQVFAVTVTEDAYLGGAHPSYSSSSCNFETKTGKMLTLRDVCKNYDDIYNEVVDYLTELNEDDEYTWLYDGWEETVDMQFYGGEDEFDEPNWFAQEDGIVIYFNIYDIAPAAVGELSVSVKLSSGKLNDKYFHEAGTAEKRKESTKYEFTQYLEQIYRPLSAQIGKWNYYECIDFFDKLGVDYECEEPFSTETDGMIWVTDPETGYTIRLMFWPIGESTIEDEYLYSLNYFDDGLNWCCDDFHHEEQVKFSVINYNIYDSMIFDSEEDFWKYLGKVVMK